MENLRPLDEEEVIFIPVKSHPKITIFCESADIKRCYLICRDTFCDLVNGYLKPAVSTCCCYKLTKSC